MPSNSRLALLAKKLLGRLPPLAGPPIRLFGADGLRHGSREAHAGSFLRERSIGFNCPAREFPRICVHELFHFAWLRLGNPRRRSYEEILRKEHAEGARGELGWSAEWRKEKLTARDIGARSRLWLEYCCESFCDTAAWMYAGVREHEEFTLAGRYRLRRRAWFIGTTRLALLV
ncbi:MAG TPA: hypothetical protein VH640_06905 [Bryobacteraceae bacterium]